MNTSRQRLEKDPRLVKPKDFQIKGKAKLWHYSFFLHLAVNLLINSNYSCRIDMLHMTNTKKVIKVKYWHTKFYKRMYHEQNLPINNNTKKKPVI